MLWLPRKSNVRRQMLICMYAIPFLSASLVLSLFLSYVCASPRASSCKSPPLPRAYVMNKPFASSSTPVSTDGPVPLARATAAAAAFKYKNNAEVGNFKKQTTRTNDMQRMCSQQADIKNAKGRPYIESRSITSTS